MKKLVILMLLLCFVPTASALFGKTTTKQNTSTLSGKTNKPAIITSSSNNKPLVVQKTIIPENKPVVKPDFFTKKPVTTIVSSNTVNKPTHIITNTKPVVITPQPVSITKPINVSSNVSNIKTIDTLNPYTYNNIKYKPINVQAQNVVMDTNIIKPITTFTPNYNIAQSQYNQEYARDNSNNNITTDHKIIYVTDDKPIIQQPQIIVVKQPVQSTPVVIQQSVSPQVIQQPVQSVNTSSISTNKNDNKNDNKINTNPVNTKKSSYTWLWITIGLGLLGAGCYYGYKKYKEKLQNDFSNNFQLQQEQTTLPTKKVSKTYPELFFIGNSIKLDTTLKYQLDLTYFTNIPKELIVKDFDTINVDGNEFEQVLLEDVNKEQYKILVDTKENKMYLFIAQYLQTENVDTSVIVDEKINFDTNEYNSVTDLIETKINNKNCYLRMYAKEDELLLLTAYPEYTNFDLGIELNKSHLS